MNAELNARARAVFVAFAVVFLAVLTILLLAPAALAVTTSEFWGPWTNLGKPASGVHLGDPVVGQNKDGRLAVFAKDVGYSKDVWHRFQTTPGGAWNSDWESQWHPSAVNLYPPVVGSNADGRLELFATGDDGNMWNKWQLAPNSLFSGWDSLGRPSDQKLVFSPAVGRTYNRLMLFTLAMDWTIRGVWQMAPNIGFSAWANWGKPGTVGLNPPVVGTNQDGRLELLAVDDNGELEHQWQTAAQPPTPPNNGWSGWDSLGRPQGTTLQSVAVGSNLDGRLEAVALTADGNLWHNWQVFPNNGWGGWYSFGHPAGVSLKAPPLVTRNQDGRLEVFITSSDGTLWHFWQVAPNNGWSGWQSLAKPTGVGLSNPAVGRNLNGRLMVFLRGSNGAVWYRQQSFTQVALQQGAGGYVGCCDTMLKNDYPNTAFAASPWVAVKSSNLYSTLIRFDLTGKIPAGATVIKATLQLYPYSQVPVPSAQPIKLFRLVRNWTAAATYNQAAAGVPWGKPGANDTVTDRLGTASATANWSTTGWKSFEVTSLVKTWYATPSTNKGVIIKDFAATEQYFNIYSSEHTTLAQRPKLTIVYVK